MSVGGSDATTVRYALNFLAGSLVADARDSALAALARLVAENAELKARLEGFGRDGLGAVPVAQEGTDGDGSAEAHAKRVAANFSEGTWEYGVALFHDHIEDNLGEVPVGLRHHVLVLTRRPAEEYFAYIQRIADSGDPIAVRVKLADLEDNMARCRGEHGGVLNARLGHRYGSAWAILNDCATEDGPQAVAPTVQSGGLRALTEAEGRALLDERDALRQIAHVEVYAKPMRHVAVEALGEAGGDRE